MRDDKDLNFLAKVDSKQLDTLVQILTIGKDGKPRMTESLTKHSLYKDNEPDHHQYWHLIADELQRFGGNSIASIVRGGKGVLYKEIATDVAEKLKITVEKTDCINEIEHLILLKIMSNSLGELSPKELMELAKELDLQDTELTSPSVMVSIGKAMKSNDIITLKIAELVANAVTKEALGNSLKLTANVALSRTLGFLLGPLGWTVTSVWTAADIAGPAYRVTIPAVIQVAFLRAQMNQSG